MGTINRYSLPAKQNVINNYVPAPFEELAAAAQIKEARTDKLDNQAAEFRDLFHNLKHVQEDDPYAKALKDELQTDVDSFYKNNPDFSTRNAKREFQKLYSKWRNDDRALNLDRTYQKRMEEEKSVQKALEEGNQLYNLQDVLQKRKAFKEGGGTFGKGFEYPNLYSPGEIVQYVKDDELRKPFEDTVNNMKASGAWSESPDGNGYLVGKGGEAITEPQLRAAIRTEQRNLMGGLVGKNLINKYKHNYGLDDKTAAEQAYKDMENSLVAEYVYSNKKQTIDSDATLLHQMDKENEAATEPSYMDWAQHPDSGSQLEFDANNELVPEDKKKSLADIAAETPISNKYYDAPMMSGHNPHMIKAFHKWTDRENSKPSEKQMKAYDAIKEAVTRLNPDLKNNEKGLKKAIADYSKALKQQSYNIVHTYTDPKKVAAESSKFFDEKSGGGNYLFNKVYSNEHPNGIQAKDFFKDKFDIDVADEEDLKKLKSGATINGEVDPRNPYTPAGKVGTFRGERFIIEEPLKATSNQTFDHESNKARFKGTHTFEAISPLTGQKKRYTSLYDPSTNSISIIKSEDIK